MSFLGAYTCTNAFVHFLCRQIALLELVFFIYVLIISKIEKSAF